MADKKNKDEAETPDEESKIKAESEESADEGSSEGGSEGAGGAAGMQGASGQCAKCGSELYDGKCINAECEIGQRQWSKSAARDTAKTTVPVPAAVTQRGRVD